MSVFLMSIVEKEDRYLTDLCICKRYKISRSTVWRWIKDGVIPPPIRIGPRAVRWRLSVLVAWERTLPSGSPAFNLAKRKH
ncbi:helix-turn-helix transcriptional regulator [Halomonas sp. 3F2F]|uniref:helix-turn-helix transcriptional regulator n=1 Tax=Halomonas sp. 3F2F TaxID=1255602 RepID=UPI00406D4258